MTRSQLNAEMLIVDPSQKFAVIKWFFNKIERFRLSARFSRVTFLDQIAVLETLMEMGS